MIISSPDTVLVMRALPETVNKAVTAVVVTYQPDLGVLATVLDAVVQQVANVVVVDNGSTQDIRGWLALRHDRREHCVALGENRGVAFAHNAGIDHAKSLDSDFVLLLDQDSIPAPDMVGQLLAVWQLLALRGKGVAAVGPRYRDPRHDYISQFVRFGVLRSHYPDCAGAVDGFIAADFLISSGSLIAMSTLDTVGLMDEGLFIDHIDTEWFLRARAMGLMAYGACDAFMNHRLGEDTLPVRLLGRVRHVPYHALVRHAYIFRNSLLLYPRAYAPWIWIIHDVKRLLFSLVFYSLFVTPRWMRLRMMLLGLWLGLCGRQGPIVGGEK